MQKKLRLALIGSGPSTLYLLSNLLSREKESTKQICRIDVYEKGPIVGVGMPYSSLTTDVYNICNISSEELPPLIQPFADWLRDRDDFKLIRWGIKRESISSSETYPRLALGEYFQSQWNAIAGRIRGSGIELYEHPLTEITDIVDDRLSDTVQLVDALGTQFSHDRVVIATGHSFEEDDDHANGYFSSPWPIGKLIPTDGEKFNFTVGTLGASLSAFDVLSSLAHRHGNFDQRGESFEYKLDPNAVNFRLQMHSANGWLPHLQYEQREAFREIYRHVTREEILKLRDKSGFLRLDIYFDKICRPALIEAFRFDQRPEMVARLQENDYSIESFVLQMTEEHSYDNAFTGMMEELPEAENSVNRDRPIHWKEVLDDLMYTLNYHAELLPAEDHLRFHSIVMPFLMNVIAALPLQSARMLLALYKAGVLELITGKVKSIESYNGETFVSVSRDSETISYRYKMFVDCSGQSPITIDKYPFSTLVDNGSVRSARVNFADPGIVRNADEKLTAKLVPGNPPALSLAGIDIDGFFRIIDDAGHSNSKIHDIAFPHTAGKRPYSYGLQACNDTAAIVVESWVNKIDKFPAPNIAEVTAIYENV